LVRQGRVFSPFSFPRSRTAGPLLDYVAAILFSFLSPFLPSSFSPEGRRMGREGERKAEKDRIERFPSPFLRRRRDERERSFFLSSRITRGGAVLPLFSFFPPLFSFRKTESDEHSRLFSLFFSPWAPRGSVSI